MHRQHPLLKDQHLAAEFFSGPGLVHIEARDDKGAVAPVESRRVTKALISPRQWLVGVILGAAAMGATTSAAANDFFDMSMPQLSAEKIMLMVRDAVGPDVAFAVTSNKNPGSDGPSAYMMPDGKGGRTCSVSTYKLDETAWTMAEGFSAESAGRMRMIVIDHEASHCDFFKRMDLTASSTSNFLGLSKDRVLRADPNEPIGKSGLKASDQQQFVDQLDSIFIKKVGTPAFGGGPMYTLMSESYADVRTVLRIGRNTILRAMTSKELTHEINEFNKHTSDFYAFRSRNAANDPLHDSSLLIKQAQWYIKNKASTPGGLKALRAEISDDGDISAMALKWSAGSVIERSARMHKDAIEQLVETTPDELQKMRESSSERVKQAVKAIPQLKKLLDNGANFGYRIEDFEGGGLKLAQEAVTSHTDLSSAYTASVKPKYKSDKALSAGIHNSLQAKLESPGALMGRIFSGNLLGGHGHSHEHSHDHHQRPGLKP